MESLKQPICKILPYEISFIPVALLFNDMFVFWLKPVWRDGDLVSADRPSSGSSIEHHAGKSVNGWQWKPPLNPPSSAEKRDELKHGTVQRRRLEWDECETLPGPSSSACGSTYSWLTTIQLEARYKIGSSIALWPFHPVNWEKSELLKRNTLYNVCVADERQSWMRDGKTHQQWPDLCPIEEIFNFRWA